MFGFRILAGQTHLFFATAPGVHRVHGNLLQEPRRAS
jgi:hypothetical protein